MLKKSLLHDILKLFIILYKETIMANINIDFKSKKGKIKPMHAVGQPPFKGGFASLDFSPMQILTDAHIPYSRLHDVGGAFGGNRYVDIPNIFRDFDADVNDPASYDFAFTDALLKGLIEHGAQPYYRLGVTIENQCIIKAYRIHPPRDYEKWAQICEHIIRHYNEGWADGFHFGIKYWEIWNEPDNNTVDAKRNQMWTGTPEQLYKLYDVASKHLKKCFSDKIKVGGYASTGFYYILSEPEKFGLNVPKKDGERYTSEVRKGRVDFFFGFLDYIKAHGSPIDFFSWHIYSTYEDAAPISEFVKRTLTEYGYGDIEIHLNEWNHSHDRNKNKACSYASAHTAAMMSTMQEKPVDMLMYYDARYVNVSSYAGFYDVNTFEPSNVYYTFKAFGHLYDLGDQVIAVSDNEKIMVTAATNGKENAVMITNADSCEHVIKTSLCGKFEAYLIDEKNMMEKVEIDPTEFTLKGYQVLLLKQN